MTQRFKVKKKKKSQITPCSSFMLDTNIYTHTTTLNVDNVRKCIGTEVCRCSLAL